MNHLQNPISTIVYLILAWLFFLLSHYKSAQALPKQEQQCMI